MNKTKYSKCPLCGGEPEFKACLYPSKEKGKNYGNAVVQCTSCELGTTSLTEDIYDGEVEQYARDAWSDWEELIEKFPACMRVQIGDVVQLLDGKRVTVASVASPDTDYGWFFEDADENQYYAESVGVWPWGLREGVTPTPMPTALQARLAGAMAEAGKEVQP